MDILDITKDLVSIASVSSETNTPVADYVKGMLDRLGFFTEQIDYYDKAGIKKTNIVGRLGEAGPGVALMAHSDVVPADTWDAPGGPFSPVVDNQRLYGRGSCDMKGSLACMLVAASRFRHEQLKTPLYIVCTADEEVGFHGARHVVTGSKLYREMVTHQTRAVIGEPTSLEVVHAHKGTCTIHAVSQGRAGHSATREGLNANLAMITLLNEMKAIYELTENDPAWHDDRFNPPSLTWNIGINDFTRAINITPAQSVCTVYFRPLPNIDASSLVERVRKIAATVDIQVEIIDGCLPLWTSPDSEFVQEVLELVGQPKSTTVCYATDGGIFSELKQRIICGPGSISQAHTDHEWIALEQLERGADLFERMIHSWCLPEKKGATKVHEDRQAEPVPDDSIIQAECLVYQNATPDDATLIHKFLEPFVEARQLLPRSQTELLTLLTHGFIVRQGDRVVGFSALEIYSQKLAEVQCLAVAPEVQGQGVGRELIQKCVARAQQKGVLELLAVTASEQLFQSCGFHYALPGQKRALFCQLDQ